MLKQDGMDADPVRRDGCERYSMLTGCVNTEPRVIPLRRLGKTKVFRLPELKTFLCPVGLL